MFMDLGGNTVCKTETYKGLKYYLKFWKYYLEAIQALEYKKERGTIQSDLQDFVIMANTNNI